MTIRRLRAVRFAPEPPPPPDLLDWADLMAVAILARSLEPVPASRSPLERALEAIELFDHSALACTLIAAGLREALEAGSGA